jgi:hypothetical protein
MIGLSKLTFLALYRIVPLLSRFVSINTRYWRNSWIKKVESSSYGIFSERMSIHNAWRHT